MPVTPYQTRKLVKAIAYRRRLLEDLPELEAELYAYVQATGTRYLAGYELEVYDSHIRLRKLEPLEYRQLKLRFEEEK